MKPADELRAAAATLRSLATAASTDGDLPTAQWTAKPLAPGRTRHMIYGDHLTREDGRVIAWPALVKGSRHGHPAYMHGQHAVYAAAMGPVVGLALAKLFDRAADEYDPSADFQEPDSAAASLLAVARAILTPEQP